MKPVSASIASAVLVMGMVAASIITWRLLPAEMPVAVQFSLDGAPNRYASKTIGLWIIPAATLAAMLVFMATAKFDGDAAAKPTFVPLWLVVVGVLAGGHAWILAHALAQVN